MSSKKRRDKKRDEAAAAATATAGQKDARSAGSTSAEAKASPTAIADDPENSNSSGAFVGSKSHRQTITNEISPAIAHLTGLPAAERSPRLTQIAQYLSHVGKILADRYELRQLIGFGTMGAVFEAVHKTEDFQRRVAVKVIESHDAHLTGRFMEEAALVSQLRHPNTARIIDFGHTSDGFLFIVMEFLEGSNLHQELKSKGALHPVRSLKIAAQVLRSLSEAHELGLIHRDLKPANIMLAATADDPDFVKVQDFIIPSMAQAVRTAAGLSNDKQGPGYGTPQYLSPEQLFDEPITPLSDLFVVGLLLYRCISGRHAFRGKTIGEMATALYSTYPPPLHSAFNIPMPAPLETTIRRAIERSPEQRFHTTIEFRGALAECLRAIVRQANEPESAAYAMVAMEDLPNDSEEVASISEENPTPMSVAPKAVKNQSAEADAEAESRPVRLSAWTPWGQRLTRFVRTFKRLPGGIQFSIAVALLALLCLAGLLLCPARPVAPTTPPPVSPPPSPTAPDKANTPETIKKNEPPVAQAPPVAALAEEKGVTLQLRTTPSGLVVLEDRTRRNLGITPLTLQVIPSDLPLRVRFESEDSLSDQFDLEINPGEPHQERLLDLRGWVQSLKRPAPKKKVH